MKTKWNRNTALALAGILCFLCCVGFFFLPLLGQRLEDGSKIAFSSAKLLFGGEQETIVNGVTYSFSFHLNAYLIATMQAFLLASFACFLGRNEKRTRIFGVVLACLALVGSVMMPWFSIWNNQGLIRDGMVRMAGSILIYVFGALGVSAEIASLLL